MIKKGFCMLIFLSIVMLSIGCSSTEKTYLLSIPDAENAVFTTDGRLFVTGGANAYQIKKDKDGNFTKTEMYSGTGNFTGIAQRGNYIYTVALISSDNGTRVSLFDAKLPCLNDANAVPALREIYQFKNVNLMNGIGFDRSGVLYVADTLGAKIVSVNISYDRKGNPAVAEKIWLECDLSLNILVPNGISIFNSVIYFTDLNSVKSAAIEPDGSPGKVSVIYTGGLTDYDDLEYFNNGLLVPDYLSGGILYVSLDGKTIKDAVPSGVLAGPSSIIQGKEPMFSSDEFIVTQKGILYDLTSDIGNCLSAITLEL